MNEEYDENQYYEDSGNQYNNEYDEYDIDISIQKQMLSQKSLVWKTTNDIYQIIEEKVEEETEILNLTFDETLLIYRYFNWNKDKIQSEYFTNEEAVRKKAGLLHQDFQISEIPNKNTFTCPICFDQTQQFDFLNCNQAICKQCWQQYILLKTQCNQACIFFKCPFENCSLIVPQSFIMGYLKTNEAKQQYKRNIGKLYCQESKSMKWCPFPGCDFAVENTLFIHQYVKCQCNNTFCFKCGKEIHSPCTCEMVQEWELKNSSESENLRWIQLYTKFCPQCRRPIEKNQGCNHMICKAPNGCGFEFCWLCLGEWKSHGEQTGGWYKCNKYEQFSVDEKEKKKLEIDKEKSTLEKYIFYFERFNNNLRARQNAINCQNKIQDIIKLLHDKLGYDQQYLQFISQANDFIIEGRQCLKWTYCFGFYIQDNNKRELFQDQQSYLENNIENLHNKIENTDFNLTFIQNKNPLQFQLFKTNIVDLTTAGLKFKKKILEFYELENV